jgi:gliding motility-associated-like protein
VLFKMKTTCYLLILSIISIFFAQQHYWTQTSCNIQASICEPGISSSFPFLSSADGPPFDFVNPQGCGTGEHGNDYGFGFVLLHITSSGPLNLQIMGNVPMGHVDFVVYNIPIGIDPCLAVLDSNNQIACNFSTQSVGCTQFGYACTGCPSIVAAPYVYAGQQVMIITHDYDNVLTSFTLELCSGVGGAQTGDFDATIMPTPMLTDTSASIQLIAATGGGTWTASCGSCINGTSGLFNPQTAGVGEHTVIYTVGNAPCTGIDTAIVSVQPYCILSLSQGNEVCANTQNTYISASTIGLYPVQYIWTSYATGDTLQITTADSTFSAQHTSDTLFNILTGTYIVSIQTAEGCVNASFINVTITPVLDSSFTYSTSVFCVNGSSISPNFIATPNSTNFYVDQPNIDIHPQTGFINMNATLPGVYTIYNRPNSCSGIGQFELIIDVAEDPTFYLKDTICAFSNPYLVLPVDSIVTPGGYFWSDNEDLDFYDTITGLIDWKTAKKDTITTIYYYSGGYCGEIDSAKIYVKQLNSYFTYADYRLCIYEVDNVLPDSIHTQTGSLLTSFFYCPDPNLVIDSLTGEIDVDASPLGEYDVYRVVYDECIDTTRRTIRIQDYFDPYFTYPVTQICQFEGLLQADTVKHRSGGIFTATPYGLAIDSTSGEIDLDFSAYGVYTIRHVTPSLCGDTAYYTLEVLEVPNPYFTYSDSLFCDVTGTILPTFVASSGGVFSATAGLIIDPSTGEIDFDLSHHGTHTVYHTTFGVCTAFTTHTIIISNTRSAYFEYESSSLCGNLGIRFPDTLATTGGTFTSVPGGLSINSLTGLINLNASTANTYNIRYVSSGVCKDTAYYSLEVLPVPSATFGYPSFAFCDAAATGIVPPSFITTPGGIFTSNAGLALNSSTGEIDLDASLNGVYPITYTTTGICPASTIQNMTVGETPVANFAYASATFCKNEPNPFPTFTSVAGGTFTSNSSLLYVSYTTGQIYLNYSSPGTYIVTYTTPGLCNSSATFTVTINAAPITTFSYPQNYYCNYNNPVSPSIMPSISGGVFSSSTGLSINSITGTIDFSTSNPGTYIISYTTPGICPTVSLYTMNVHPSVCNCTATLPIFEAYINGNLVSLNNINLCYGDTLEFKPQLGSSWQAHPIFPGSTQPYSPQLGMDIYSCPPTVFAPNDLYSSNSCYTGSSATQTGHFWTIINDTANFSPFVNYYDDTTVYLIPFTKYNATTVSVFNPALGNRCYALDAVEVHFLPTIQSNYNENCLDSSATFVFTGGLPSSNGSSYSFSAILPTTASMQPAQVSEGDEARLYPIPHSADYSFTITDDNGCMAEFSHLNFTGTPIALVGNDTTICMLTGNLSAYQPDFGVGYWIPLTGGMSITDTLNNSSTFSVNSPGLYTLVWRAASNPNCYTEDTVNLIVSEISLTANITETYCFARDGAISIEAQGGVAPYQYSITNGTTYSSNPSFNQLSEGIYVIRVTDSTGCYANETVEIGLTTDCELIFYNGFTPNGDNINDTWFIEGLPPGNHPVVILNRWGDVVWETAGYDNWTNSFAGKNLDGKELPVGVYYYIVNIGEAKFSGFIELTR